MTDSVLNIITTNKCNADCPYCIVKQTPEMCNNYDDFNIRRLPNAIQYTKNLGVQTCKITGKGEPTLNPARLKNILYVITDSFPIVELQTNGFTLEDLLINWNFGIDNTNVTTISISCNHYLQERNTILFRNSSYSGWLNTTKLINLASHYGFTVRLSCTLIKGYIDSFKKIKEFIDYFKTCPVDQFSFIPVGSYGDNEYAKWSEEHGILYSEERRIYNDLKTNGTILYEYNWGGTVFDYEGNNVYFANCLTEPKPDKETRQLIYYPDGHLRYSWTHKGAIIF